MPQATFPQILIITTQGERNYPFPPGTIFSKFIPPNRKGGEEGNYGAAKVTKIKHCACIGHKFC